MGELVSYLIPALVVLLLVAFTAWIVYINVAQRKPKTAVPEESEHPQSIVVPTEQHLRETFETYQQGGTESLLRLFEGRQRPTEQTAATSQYAPPNETPQQPLKKLIQESTPTGMEVVKGNSADLGPISFMRLPQFTEEQERRLASEMGNRPNETQPSDDGDSEEHFRNYWERRRRFAQGLPPGPVTEEHFRPKKN
jgi:hypothetical protein